MQLLAPIKPRSSAAVSPRSGATRGGLLQRKCACGGKAGSDGECEECRKKTLQRRASTLAPSPQGSAQAPSIVHQVLRSPGQPLETATRRFLEPRLGHDFGHVRVHTDAQAAESARAVGAEAYTVGRDVVFAAGSYRPHTADGRSLISHELAHVVQQGGTAHHGGDLQIGEVHSAAEREADSVAQRVESGSSVQVATASGSQLQRKWDWKRFGKGFAIGGLLGAGIGAALLGPAGLLVGLGTGLIGGIIGALTGDEEKAKQKPPPKQPPPPAPLVAGCTPAMDGMIAKGIDAGLGLLRTTTSALTGLDPKSPANDASRKAATALQKFFKSDDARVANHVNLRLQQIQTFMTTLAAKRAAYQPATQPAGAVPPTECHSETADDDCGRAIAYVPEVKPGHTEREGMVFCPRFFKGDPPKKDEDLGGIIIHEAAHSLVGGQHIGDRAYLDLRFAPDLTTEEALTNADSYRGFVQQVAGATEPRVGHIFVDILEGCGADDELKINQALRRIQQWFSVSLRVVHDKRPEWRALQYWVDLRRKHLGGTDQALVDTAARSFDSVAGLLGAFVSGRCHPQNDATCPAGQPTASGPGAMGPEIQLCPDWLKEPDADRRAVLVLAELLGSAGINGQQARLNHAELARQLFLDLGQAPKLEDILKPLEPVKDTTRPTGPRVSPPPP